MKTSIIPSLDNNYSSTFVAENINDSPYCSLKWRMGQLLVLPAGQQKQVHLPAFDRIENLVECLKHSPVNLVRIDPRLGEMRVKTWIEACAQAGKPIYLNISSLEKHFQSPSNFSKPLKQVFEWMIALLLFLTISPIFLSLMIMMRIYSPGALFSQTWYVGKRGRIFKLLRFRAAHVQDEIGLLQHSQSQKLTPLGSLLQKSGLDNLPQLLNILRGEISLFGNRGWSLEDALTQNRELLSVRQGLLGISGTWQVDTEPSLLHLDSQAL